MAVNVPELLIVDQSCSLKVRAETASELVFAVGRPLEDKEKAK